MPCMYVSDLNATIYKASVISVHEAFLRELTFPDHSHCVA